MNRDLPYVTFCLLRVDAILPEKGTVDSAGFDLASVENLTLSPGARAWIPTGIMFQIPRHLYGQIMSRSGLAVMGIDVAAGVIDPDYQGEIRVLLVNNSGADFSVHAGDRIAQIIFIRILNQKRMYPVDHQPSRSSRGISGFGSTGIRNDQQDQSTTLNYQAGPSLPPAVLPATQHSSVHTQQSMGQVPLHGGQQIQQQALPQQNITSQMHHLQIRYPVTYSPMQDEREFYNYAC